MTAGHYLAGLCGLGLLRRWYEGGPDLDDRLDELSRIVAGRHEFPFSLPIDPTEMTVSAGYEAWAPDYDTGRNPMVEAEEQVVHPWLDEVLSGAPAVVLDAGCGTGRHAAHLALSGCTVIGVDASEAMLGRARQRVPEGRFEIGRLEALPLADASVDLAVCALALCHLPDPTLAVAELARVVRRGGTIVISDPHPVSAVTGGQAFFGGLGSSEGFRFVRNHHHPFASWLTAFRRADLAIVDCVEILMPDAAIETNVAAQVFPSAVRAAGEGLPFVLCWRLRRC